MLKVSSDQVFEKIQFGSNLVLFKYRIIKEEFSMLPQKTYVTKDCVLHESDYDVSKQVKLHRLMEFMQDLATEHAFKLGFGWDYMDKNGLFWVISKYKIVFDKPVDRSVRSFKLYTWPIAPNKFFIERRFVAVNDSGEQLFSATTIWMIVERDTRKIASQEVINKFYRADFDDTPCDADTSFERIRKDDGYELSYEREIRRTDLDINRHVNNTNYINFAIDVADCSKTVKQAEIVYHKELKLADCVKVFSKNVNGNALIIGERNGETCFTAKLILQ